MKKIFYIPPESFHNFEAFPFSCPLITDDQDFTITYDGTRFNLIRMCSYLSDSILVSPDSLVMIDFGNKAFPKVSLFIPPSLIGVKYYLWLYGTWTNSRIKHSIYKYNKIKEAKRNENSIYEIKYDNVSVFYYTDFDDNLNPIPTKSRKGLCYLNIEDPNVKVNVIKLLIESFNKGLCHKWKIPVLTTMDKFYDLINKEIFTSSKPDDFDKIMDDRISKSLNALFKEGV